MGLKYFPKIFSKLVMVVLLFRLTSWPVHGKREMGLSAFQLFRKVIVVIPVNTPVEHGEDLSGANVL